MNLSYRIQHLRKVKGLSQEELANAMGISRQAVSKWESEQSVPDVEKIILLSDFFGVTTDYLLKGAEPTTTENTAPSPAPAPSDEVHTTPFDLVPWVIACTAANAFGVILASCLWKEYQNSFAFAAEFFFLILGTAVFADIQHAKRNSSNSDAMRPWLWKFWSINAWIYCFAVGSWLFDWVVCRCVAPYPLLFDWYFAPLFVVPLVAVGLGVRGWLKGVFKQ